MERVERELKNEVPECLLCLYFNFNLVQILENAPFLYSFVKQYQKILSFQ